MEDNNKSQKIMIEIPAFTVLKNNSSLKNVFLFHKQQSSSNQDFDEQILLVGRHPNCNIILEHPSISRYHLRIHSNPSKHSISIFDLSSVHGTWVSGKRIEPGVHVELKEGDTVKMGGSSRVYELHWFPINQAYDGNGKFMSTIYTIKERDEETNQDEKPELLLSRDDLDHHDSPVRKLDLMTRSDLDCLTSSCDDTESECSSQFKAGNGTLYEIQDSDGLNTSENQSNWSSDEISYSLKMVNCETDKVGPLSCNDTKSFQDLFSVSETVSAIEDSVSLNKYEDELNWLNDNLINEPDMQNDGSIEEIPFSGTKFWLSESADGINWLMDNLSNEFELQNHEIINKSENQSNLSSDNMTDNLKMADHETHKDVLLYVPDCSKSSCADTALFQHPLIVSETIPEIQDSDRLNFSEDELNWLMDNMSNEYELQKGESIKEDTISVINFPLSESENGLDWLRDNLSDEFDMENHGIIGDVTELEHLSPSNGNIETLATVHVGFSEIVSAIQDSVSLNNSNHRLNCLDDISNDDYKLIQDFFSVPMCSQSCHDSTVVSPCQTGNKKGQIFATISSPSPLISVPVAHYDDVSIDEDVSFIPDKENKNPNAFSVKSSKKGRTNDVCSLTANEKKDAISISRELLTCAVESDSAYLQSSSNNVDKKILGGAKKRWTMVVDTSSLLHSESLKHLKLLEGLKGTQIVIPQIVIKDLMDVKSQDNILKRNTKKVSLALKWIDECMANTKKVNSKLESEIVETALNLCKEDKDRKIVILSNDLTLKIKAMAEGIMCEEAEEFYRSLVNPFSERFMWVGSSAIGLTWSCVNDDILKQKYYGCGVNGSHGLKGLKLLANDATFC